MATTILPQETAPSATPQTLSPSRRAFVGLGWVLVAVAVVLAALLAVRALGSDGQAEPAPWFSVEHGSITALDHAAEQQARSRPFAVESGSIAALDHAAEAGPISYSVEHGSITAIDHAADDAANDG